MRSRSVVPIMVRVERPTRTGPWMLGMLSDERNERSAIKAIMGCLAGASYVYICRALLTTWSIVLNSSVVLSYMR